MVAKIVRISILMLLFSGGALHAQTSDAMKKEHERYVRKSMEEFNERRNIYVEMLNVDDFKGEIIKQKIDEYYKKLQEIMLIEIPEYEKIPLIEQLNATHFNDVEELYAEETMASVKRFIIDNKAEIKKLQKTKKTKKNN